MVVGPLDFEALGYSLPHLWVNPALYIYIHTCTYGIFAVIQLSNICLCLKFSTSIY